MITALELASSPKKQDDRMDSYSGLDKNESARMGESALDKLIYVVEDDENIREFVRMALNSFSYQVRGFESAEDALQEVAEHIPDLFILDIMLGGISGLEATKLLRQDPKTSTVPIILLSAKDTELDKVTGLDCGADDYISKPFSVMELGARIRAALRRTDQALLPNALTAADLSLNLETREVTKAGVPLQLTYKEYELLNFLMQERNRIVPRRDLLEAVWDTDFEGESRTLDMHIRTLRSKLNDNPNSPRYIKTIRGVGYRFIGDEG
jgi:two-component system alkaline phosphatase synthesis response regulator PhoP